ncbi:MAG TPA: preprotein translocase subunit SecE [Thermoleophilaceae bacterium]|jgi:preprotein translocase SecE subunit
MRSPSGPVSEQLGEEPAPDPAESVARDRQRAKQRQAERREARLRQRREGGQRDGGQADGAPAAGPDATGGPDAPGAVPDAPPENLGRSDATAASPPPEPILDDAEVDELFLDEEDERPDQEELYEAEAEAGFAPRGRRGDSGETAAAGPRRAPAKTGEPTHGGAGGRVVGFLRACWAELQRVQWPDRRALTQLTAIVLVFILIMGSYLGALDAIFSRVIQEII